CDMCQHWHGGPAMAIMFEDRVHVVAGEDQIGVYESSAWAERAFCKTCGTTLYYRLKSEDAPYGAQAGLFDLPKGFSIHEEIFVDEQPDYYRFDTTAPRLTGAQVMKRFEKQMAKKQENT
ncbi:MAG: GFA family protein, partial [Pseudomonadota bacterium]